MEKLIYNNKDTKFIILDSDNKFISNIIKDEYIDTSLLALPSNVLNNPDLYLGKDYIVYNCDLSKFNQVLENGYISDYIQTITKNDFRIRFISKDHFLKEY